MRRQRNAWLSSALLLLMAPLSAHATSCEGDCEGDRCTGGCTINSLSCSTTCSDAGCPGSATCQEYGDYHDCYHSFSSECKQGDQESPESQSLTFGGIAAHPEWALLRYEQGHFSPVHWDDVTTVASSSQLFARHAVDDLVEDSQRQAERRRQSRSSRDTERRDWSPPRVPRLHFVVSPSAPCASVAMELEPRALAEPLGDQATIFVRAAVDGDGRIAGAHLLHSSVGEVQTRAMIELLKRNARIRSTDRAAGALEAFIVLFTKTGSDVGWIVSAAQPLH